MRNLKRVLSTIMAVAMMMSLVVFSTSAAFEDQDKIENTDAVDKMVALNIINGLPDGSFNPTGTVTRAEMSKMIYIALNGGNDMNASGVQVPSSFTDTKGHWAEAYIEYCVNLGIVAGMGDKSFAPNQGVTATQAAKMLLVALGYDADYEKFVGPNWALNTNRIAVQKGLYDELAGINANAPMSRDNAAQMVYNFCDAEMVKYEFGISGTGGSVTGVKQAEDIAGQTVLTKFYKLVSVTGQISAITYDKTKKEYGYTIAPNNDWATTGTTYYTANDYSALFGLSVTVYVKDKSSSTPFAYDRANDTIYDIVASNSAVIAEGYTGDFGAFTANKTMKFAGTTYDINGATVPVHTFVQGAAAGSLNGANAAGITAAAPYKATLIDLNDDGKVDNIVVQPFTVEKVTYVGSDNATFGTQGNEDFDDINVYNNIAKNDYVCYYDKAFTMDGKDTVVKADVETGKITGTRGTPTEYLVGGSWYTKDGSVSSNLSLNDTIDYVAFGGIFYHAKTTESGVTSKDIAMVINAGLTSGGADAGKYEAKLLFGDGTKKVVTVSKVNGKDPTSGNTYTVPTGAVSTGNADLIGRIGSLVTYVVDGSDYELTDIYYASATQNNIAGMDTAGSSAQYNDEAIGGKELADDAIVFAFIGSASVAATANDGKVYTGKEIKNTFGSASNPSGHAAAQGVASLAVEVNGFEYGKVALINSSSALTISSSDNYGYLVSDTYRSDEGSKTYRVFEIWNGTAVVTVREEKSGTLYPEGTIISYDIDGEGMIKNVAVPAVATDGVKGWDGNEKIALYNLGNSKVTKDTTVLYINSKDVVGVAGGDIALAKDALTPNVRYIAGASELELLVVDVKANMVANPTIIATTLNNTTAAAVDTALKTYDKVIVTGTYSSDNLTIPVGKTVEFQMTPVLGAKTITVYGDLVLTNGATLTTGNVNVKAIGSVAATTAGTIDDASCITGVAGAAVSFATGVTVSASATLYYADNADNTADGASVPASYIWTAGVGSRTTAGWLLQ